MITPENIRSLTENDPLIGLILGDALKLLAEERGVPFETLVDEFPKNPQLQEVCAEICATVIKMTINSINEEVGQSPT